MLDKAVNGFTAAAVDRALRGLDQKLTVRVRGELLDLDNGLLYNLKGLLAEGSVSHNVDQPVRRSADLRFIEIDRDSQHPAPLISFINTIASQGRLVHARLNESSGSTVNDYTGSHSGTYAGSPVFSVGSLAAGDSTNNAVTFMGTSYAFWNSDTWLNVTRLTLALAWRGTNVSQALWDRDNGSDKFWRLELDSSGYLRFKLNFTSGSYTTYATTVALNDGKPHLIHAVYDGAYVSLWADGKRLLHTAETRTMKTTGTCNVGLGINAEGLNASTGTFDEAGIVGRALTNREIRDEYQSFSEQLKEIMLDRDRGDRVKIWYGVKMLTNGTDGTPWAEWPQIVAILSSPKRSIQRDESIIDNISCQDQTRILTDDKFKTRWTLAAGENVLTGTNGVLAIAQGAGFNTATWGITATALTTPAAIDFEIGSSRLEAINYLLTQTINYKPLRFSGAGAGIIEPAVLDVNIALSDTLATDSQGVILLEGMSEEIEARKVVNQVVVANANPDAPDILGTATNANSNNPSSQTFLPPNIKRVQADVANQTTADNTALQLLQDETARFARRIRLSTYPRPIHDDRDRIRLTVTLLDRDEEFVEEGWRLPLSPGEMMEHDCLSIVDVR